MHAPSAELVSQQAVVPATETTLQQDPGAELHSSVDHKPCYSTNANIATLLVGTGLIHGLGSFVDNPENMKDCVRDLAVAMGQPLAGDPAHTGQEPAHQSYLEDFLKHLVQKALETVQQLKQKKKEKKKKKTSIQRNNSLGRALLQIAGREPPGQHKPALRLIVDDEDAQRLKLKTPRWQLQRFQQFLGGPLRKVICVETHEKAPNTFFLRIETIADLEEIMASRGYRSLIGHLLGIRGNLEVLWDGYHLIGEFPDNPVHLHLWYDNFRRWSKEYEVHIEGADWETPAKDRLIVTVSSFEDAQRLLQQTVILDGYLVRLYPYDMRRKPIFCQTCSQAGHGNKDYLCLQETKEEAEDNRKCGLCASDDHYTEEHCEACYNDFYCRSCKHDHPARRDWPKACQRCPNCKGKHNAWDFACTNSASMAELKRCSSYHTAMPYWVPYVQLQRVQATQAPFDVASLVRDYERLRQYVDGTLANRGRNDAQHGKKPKQATEPQQNPITDWYTVPGSSQESQGDLPASVVISRRTSAKSARRSDLANEGLEESGDADHGQPPTVTAKGSSGANEHRSSQGSGLSETDDRNPQKSGKNRGRPSKFDATVDKTRDNHTYMQNFLSQVPKSSQVAESSQSAGSSQAAESSSAASSSQTAQSFQAAESSQASESSRASTQPPQPPKRGRGRPRKTAEQPRARGERKRSRPASRDCETMAMQTQQPPRKSPNQGKTPFARMYEFTKMQARQQSIMSSPSRGTASSALEDEPAPMQNPKPPTMTTRTTSPSHGGKAPPPQHRSASEPQTQEPPKKPRNRGKQKNHGKRGGRRRNKHGAAPPASTPEPSVEQSSLEGQGQGQADPDADFSDELDSGFVSDFPDDWEFADMPPSPRARSPGRATAAELLGYDGLPGDGGCLASELEASEEWVGAEASGSGAFEPIVRVGFGDQEPARPMKSLLDSRSSRPTPRGR